MSKTELLLFFFFCTTHLVYEYELQSGCKTPPSMEGAYAAESQTHGPWEGAVCRRRGQLLPPPWPGVCPCSPGIRFAVVLPCHNVLKELPAGDPARKQGESRSAISAQQARELD